MTRPRLDSLDQFKMAIQWEHTREAYFRANGKLKDADKCAEQADALMKRFTQLKTTIGQK